jgi:uncharacterized protein (TIGR03067 family)
MRLCWSALILAVVLGCGVVQPGESSDQAAWQGTWKMVSTIYNGETQKAELRWIVAGDHYNVVLDGVTHNDPYPFTLDPTRQRIDVNHHDTPKGTYGGKLRGIYKVSADSLTVCYDLTGTQYPKAFDAGPGSRRVLYQFRRESR